MTLLDYLNEPGRTATAFASTVGCSVSTITRAAGGKVLPSRELMVRIFRETQGAVEPNDFFDLAAVKATLNPEPLLPFAEVVGS